MTRSTTMMIPNLIAFLFFTVFLFFALNARHYQARAFSTSRSPTVTPTRVPLSSSSSSSSAVAITKEISSTRLNTISSTILASADFFEESDYVKKVEHRLIELSQIHDDDTRRTTFEQFVTHRLQEELLVRSSTRFGDSASITTNQLKLRSLNFVKAMDASILKLGLSAQEQGWNKHVTSGFQQQDTNTIWPYVDMLIQFKILLSNIERTNATQQRLSSSSLQTKKSIASPGQHPTTPIESYIDDIVGGGRRASSSSRRRRSTALAATASSSSGASSGAATTSTTPIVTAITATTGSSSSSACNMCNTCKNEKTTTNKNKMP